MSFAPTFLGALAVAADVPPAPPGAELGLPFAVSDAIPHLASQLEILPAALVSLPLAAALGAALAFRPRRSGTPPRTPAVIQTQILLALVGAVVMLVVGQSLARAFGIVGVASLVRYRAKVDDPKDAGVMLAALSVGLAAGVGLHVLAIVSTLFLLAFLWWVESIVPAPTKRFHLTVKTTDSAALRSPIERVLRRHHVPFELRTASPDALCYEVKLPFDRGTDAVSNAITALNGQDGTAVEWEEKKAS